MDNTTILRSHVCLGNTPSLRLPLDCLTLKLTVVSLPLTRMPNRDVSAAGCTRFSNIPSHSIRMAARTRIQRVWHGGDCDASLVDGPDSMTS